jgi:hypothetical protein
MWDLWWTKWHWDRFFLEYFGFLLSISFHRYSITCKNKKKLIIFHLHHRVAQEALRLRCVRSICSGALHHKKKRTEQSNKGKFVPIHDMKPYRGIRIVAPLILNLGTRRE